MGIRPATLARLVAILLASLLLAAASAQSKVPVEHAFAESVAERMGFESARCDGQTVDMMRHRGGSALCYRHDFGDFASFKRAWDEAAEWQDVFTPDAAEISEMRASGARVVDGWWSLTQEMRHAGIESGFDTFRS